MDLSKEIEHVNFGDTRIDSRCKHLFKRMYNDPDRSFPKIADSWGALKASYRFMNNPKVSREKLLSAHIQQTVIRCNAQRTILVVQDTTTLSYNHHPKTDGLGHVGTPRSGLGYGMLVHNTCAIAADSHEPLGMLHQEVMVRNKLYPKEENYCDRLKRNRESDKWLNGVKKTKELLPNHPHLLHIADREADIYFFMRNILNANQGFVIRQMRDRKTDAGLMSTSIASSKKVGDMQVIIARNGSRKARTAEVSLYSGAVVIYPPKAINQTEKPLSINLVVAKEDNPPIGTTPLGWILLTTESVDSQLACIQVVEHYQGRWTIEEFHKALKTGCGIEERQLTTREGLENILGMSSIIAILLLHLKYQAKVNETDEAVILSPIQKNILLNKFPKLTSKISNQQALRHIAMLGGFIGRKHDGNPGWITLMAGYEKMLTMEQGYILALAMIDVGKR